jgi:[ribosomal protein S5]-alanine N-acetyltransferase
VGLRDPGPPADTARLLLRPFTADDVDDILALDGDPRVMRYINGGIPGTRDDAQATVGRILRRYVEHPGTGAWRVARRDDARFCGWVSLKHADTSPDIEIGYRLMHHAWGQGFATELARAMVRRGFDGLALERIIGVTDPDNAASQRVLRKIGMRDEGFGHYYGRDLRLFAIARVDDARSG